jgi:hypothetical protein
MAQESLGLRCAGFSPAFARTQTGILTSVRSTGGFHPGFTAYRTLPYPCNIVARPSFGGPLNPDHSRRIHAGLVSYYALFKGMAASKPTSQLSRHEHILRYTQRPLWGLSCGSGFFPFCRRTLSLGDCLPGSMLTVFGVWLGLVPATPARAHPVALPPQHIFPRLYLNRFRGEPAISRLDWPFTPTHKSSERFSTHTGSGLH